MRVLLGVSYSDSLASKPIVLVSEAVLNGPWTFGGERPATHAFPVIDHGDGYRWRLDAGYGEDGRAMWSPCPSTPNVRLWQLTGAFDHEKAARKALALTGEKYDDVELVAQGAAVLARFAPPPMRPLLEHVTRGEFCKDAMICTHVTLTVLAEGGVVPADGHGQLRDLIPERLSQWASRTAQLPVVP